MRILYLNTTIQCGGAEQVVSQLLQGMEKRGHKVYQISCYDTKHLKLPANICVLYRSFCMRMLNRLLTGNHGNKNLYIWYSRQYICAFIKKYKIDVVHFHNLHDNFLGIRDIARIAGLRPTVWTLHDFWALTGHCASPYGCDGEKWKKGCGSCSCLGNYPALRNDVSHQLFQEKQKAFRMSGITFTVPSGWLLQQFQQSHLQGLPCEQVYNSLDTALWHPLDGRQIRKKYGIPEGEKVIGFIAADPEKKLKGMSYVLEALHQLPDPKQYLLLIAGKEGKVLEGLKETFRVRHLGYLSAREALKEFYTLADVLINPSVYDTFGLTNIEAMACGTPVIAFPVCAMPEIIDESCGWIAEEVSGDALAKTICQAFSDPESMEEKKKGSRRRAEWVFSEEKMLDRFEEIYQKKAAEGRNEHED